MIEKSNLDLRPVNELLKEEFFVPSYQRGYRWSNREVTALLDDILEFCLNSQNSPKEVFYCLQPLVVSRQNNEWVLVDGQQRLTTIYLILDFLKDGMSFLGKKNYKLRYETRADSGLFLQHIDFDKKLDNVDYYHICEARTAIENWFSERDGAVKMPILNTLLNDDMIGKNVKVIWYEIEKEDAIDIFTRINIGKIPLTNAELIKALFLRSRNFMHMDTLDMEEVVLKQIEIASAWDVIENTLQEDKFWYFINDNDTKYDTRIEFIFDIIQNKEINSTDHLYTFIKYSEEFDNSKGIEEIWKEVKKHFLVLEEWYQDHTLYHLIGYIICTKTEKIGTLIKKSLDSSKSDFEKYLTEIIKNKFKGDDLEELNYNSRRKTIKDVLLLFNIETMLQNDISRNRFPFDEYVNQSWDIEHISSIASDMPGPKKSRKWMEDVLEYFSGTTVLDHYEKSNNDTELLVKDIQYLLQQESYSIDAFKNIYQKVLIYFKEDRPDDDTTVNTLSNLALLDSTTNRGYKNAVFPVKRRWILNNESKGLFVPICTKNLFLKYYSKKLENIMFWQPSDSGDYFDSLQLALKKYF